MIKWFEKEDIVALVIAVLIALLIFYVSSQSFEKGSPGPNFKFKPVLYHFGVFFLFAFFISLALIKGKIENKYLILLAIIFGIALAATDELHQLFVPNRSCGLEDFFTDFAGILGAGVVYILTLVFRR